jgi:hypothetical protein
VVVVGVVLSVLPHLIWWGRIGEPVYFADHDDTLYLSVSGQAYYNHPFRLGDPSTVGSAGSSYYPPLQFVPAVALARALGVGPERIDLIWRVFSGVSLAAAVYLLVRLVVARPWVAAAVAAAVVADAGLTWGQPLLRPALVALSLARGGASPYLQGYPQIATQFRLITPGLSLWALLLHVWLVVRARERPSPLRLGLSGLGFGLLFHTYFYFWTAAGLALVVAFVLDARGRRAYLATAVVGGLIGLPAIVAGMLVKAGTPPDWQHRTDTFLPIARTAEWIVPKLAVVTAAVAGPWVFFRRRDLFYLWALSAAGLMLLNHQVITGLQIQNFHWGYVWGPCLSLLVVLLIASELSARPVGLNRPAAVVWLAALPSLALGLGLRWVEASRTEQTLEIMRDYQDYRALRRAADAPRLAPNAVLAGDPGFVELGVGLENLRPLLAYATMFAPQIRHGEYARRVALNGYLLGRDRAAFEAEQSERLAADWGPWRRDPSLKAVELKTRLSAYDSVAADPMTALRAFRVRYVALPAGQAPPSAGAGGSWSRLQHGPRFNLWELIDRDGGSRIEIVSPKTFATR